MGARTQNAGHWNGNGTVTGMGMEARHEMGMGDGGWDGECIEGYLHVQPTQAHILCFTQQHSARVGY